MTKKLSIPKINGQIEAAGHNWKAGRSAISQLSEDNQDARLGLEVPEGETDRIEMMMAHPLEAAFSFAGERDWRDKDSKDWVTEVQNQGSCGSCVAFGTVATIECQANIQTDKPDLDLDLSEADLFFCGAGKKCSQGWWPSYALEYAKNKGIADEPCFEYEDHDMNCKLCSDKADRHVKIGSWKEIINVDQRKQWLDEKGPMVACMAVYRDFFSYKEGVYRHTTGDLAGYHAVCCIGYSEEDECWICKNSWKQDWGDKGFFKIGYGEADMDTKFAMYGVEELYGPLVDDGGEDEDEDVWKLADHIAVGYSFEDNRRVLWAYVDGKWRYQLVSDVQLTGLAGLLALAKPVQVCFKDDKLTRVRLYRTLS